MIVSYETLRTLTAHLANCKIGLLLCDEGHRLKNSGKGHHTASYLPPVLKAKHIYRVAHIPGFELSRRETSRDSFGHSYPGIRLLVYTAQTHAKIGRHHLERSFGVLLLTQFRESQFLGIEKRFSEEL